MRIAAGAPATAACTYDFPATDVDSFLALANVLEGVGVSAYLGAAASIANKEYLTDAGSILTVEARHSSYLRAVVGEVPFPQPFDNPLDFDEVYTLASAFIVSCPSSNPTLPVKAFPSLTATSDGTIEAGSMVSLTPGQSFTASGPIYAAFITVTGPVWATITPNNDGYSVTIPNGIAGQSYVVLTSSKDKVSDDTVLAGPAIIEIGAKNGRLSTDCTTGSNGTTTGSNGTTTGSNGTTTGSLPGHSTVPGQGGQTATGGQTTQYGQASTPSSGLLFTGAASNVQPTVGLLAVMGVLAFL
ncbi:ferritin-like domain-containing protein [Penicillium atrosanguineum]|uniref:Ferritin-like domain-containing protein n=1 Tax=Penicillium atrosanguineum TaxID=1132637 RepID=A0A9W9GYG5_9EURO|nr:ferritin-like domain-containing protein [Penicillium atrosanguineum]KAJ5138191.1 ferritin-like domain-containing protein [Penicillium atrosanguineum]KAJ5307085.1 ferritin-like domain-containing protein [Penicillium atrosanguineum]